MLQVRGLTRRFGEKTAVDRVDLDILSGQMVGIIGPSGAGKSTLLRMINRLQEPTSGTILFGTTNVTQLKGKQLRAWRTECAMIFQQFNLIARLDVLTNVLIGRLNHRSTLRSLFMLFGTEERAMALAALERFDLGDTAFNRASQISGGQQQRVAICRALLQEPKIILADEPIASLDPRNAQIVMDALRRVNREDGLTVLCNLHHLDTARTYCDRIVAMQRGRIAFDGAPSELTMAGVRDIYGVGESEFSQERAPNGSLVPA